ncbi:MAG: NADH-quinone oxidoreductase subunit L [Rickettsiaceae bacterium]|nr:MAG: NADH-quinone oxidoreductase subunit L [Rickettsiaceae bacterium]
MKFITILAVFLPLISAIFNGIFGKVIDRKLASFVGCMAIILSAFLSTIIFYYIDLDIIHVLLGEWFRIKQVSVNWSIYLDSLSSLMFLIITWISALVHIYSLGYMSEDKNLPKFLSYLSFFTFFMLILVSADNFLQLFCGWEGVGLCSYLLIGFWYEKPAANIAAVKAFLINRISDFAFLTSILLIIIHLGDVNFSHIFANAQLLSTLKLNLLGFHFFASDVICLLLLIGCVGKSAQIGFHVWLPDAMEGPTPASALIHAATMVTAGVFLLTKCSYLFEYSPWVLQITTAIGAFTCLFAASIAVMQQDIKKIIAYSTCSQLGYMFFACGISAYPAAMFHLATHACFKALLFLAAGNIIHACHHQDIFELGGLKNKMPITYACFWIGSLAIIGIFPMAGFYSKDLILELAFASFGINKLSFYFGIAAAILTAVYSVKMIIFVFHGDTQLEYNTYANISESSYAMNIPVIILAACSIFAGMIGYHILGLDEGNNFFANSIFNIRSKIIEIPVFVKMMPMVGGLLGMLIATNIYLKKGCRSTNKLGIIKNLLSNKYFFDEIYDYLIIKNIKNVSNFMYVVDKKVIDHFGTIKVTQAMQEVAFRIRNLQTGYIFNYVLVVCLTLVACLTYFLINFIVAI